MDYIILAGSFFDFDMSKLATPLTIIGIVLMLLSIFLVAGANKIDDKIRAKRRRDIGGATAQQDNNESSSDVVEGDSTDSKSVSEPTISEENRLDVEESTPIFRHSDGSVNYYMILKILGLVMVLASAIMIIVGMK